MFKIKLTAETLPIAIGTLSDFTTYIKLYTTVF
jgi:hypothetical protein